MLQLRSQRMEGISNVDLFKGIRVGKNDKHVLPNSEFLGELKKSV